MNIRSSTCDRRIRPRCPAKTRRINLGLELLSAVAKPGTELTARDIAAWCGCTEDSIYLIERVALSKIGNKLRFGAAKAAR